MQNVRELPLAYSEYLFFFLILCVSVCSDVQIIRNVSKGKTATITEILDYWWESK